MPLKRWYFVRRDEAIYLYDSSQSDITKAARIKLPKSRSKEDLGPVKKIETTDGKKEKVAEKYGPDNGLVVSYLAIVTHRVAISSVCVATVGNSNSLSLLFLDNMYKWKSGT